MARCARPSLPDGFYKSSAQVGAVCQSCRTAWAGTDTRTPRCSAALCKAGVVLRENTHAAPCCWFKSFPFILRCSHLAWWIRLLKMCSSTTSSSKPRSLLCLQEFYPTRAPKTIGGAITDNVQEQVKFSEEYRSGIGETTGDNAWKITSFFCLICRKLKGFQAMQVMELKAEGAVPWCLSWAELTQAVLWPCRERRVQDKPWSVSSFLWEKINERNFCSGTLPHPAKPWWDPKQFVGALQMDFSWFFLLLDSKDSATF